MNTDTIVGIASAIAFGFLVGYWAGEERSTIELKPCPMTNMSLTTKTTWPDGRVTCQYAVGHARAKKEMKL